MTSTPRKSTATLWAQAPGPAQKYRDRQRITLPTGEKRDVAGYGPTRRAATADLTAKVQRLLAQATIAETITVTQLMARLLRHKRSVKGRKRKTIHNDLDLFKRHVQPYIGSMAIADVTLADLEGIQARLTSAGHYRTAELATILLGSLYKHALRIYRGEIRAGTIQLFDITEDLDAIQRPAEARRKPPETWTVEQLQAFLAAAKARYDASLGNLLYPAFHAAIAAGLRRGELLGLQRSDLRRILTPNGHVRHALVITRQLVYYQAKHHPDTPKSAAGERTVPIGPELATALEEHQAKLKRVATLNPNWVKNDLMFPSYNGRPLDPGSLYRARDQLLKELDLPHVTLHELRSVYATYLTRELVQRGTYSPKLVMQLLGHSHPNVALRHYNRVIEEDLAMATFDPSSSTSLDKSLDNSSEEKGAASEETAS